MKAFVFPDSPEFMSVSDAIDTVGPDESLYFLSVQPNDQDDVRRALEQGSGQVTVIKMKKSGLGRGEKIFGHLDMSIIASSDLLDTLQARLSYHYSSYLYLLTIENYKFDPFQKGIDGLSYGSVIWTRARSTSKSQIQERAWEQALAHAERAYVEELAAMGFPFCGRSLEDIQMEIRREMGDFVLTLKKASARNTLAHCISSVFHHSKHGGWMNRLLTGNLLVSSSVQEVQKVSNFLTHFENPRNIPRVFSSLPTSFEVQIFFLKNCIKQAQP